MCIRDSVNNAARISVIRPAVDQEAKEAEVTVSIYDKNTSVSASKTFKVRVPALTKDEIDKELKLIKEAKAHYFDGIKAGNADANNIISDLKPFTEVRFAADGSSLQWVYSTQDMEGYGIVPEALDGWQTLDVYKRQVISQADCSRKSADNPADFLCALCRKYHRVIFPT